MTTITININDDSVVDDLAAVTGYLAVNPLTQVANPKTKPEHIKDVLVKNIIGQVTRKRLSPDVAEADVRSAVESEIS
jgi:hypothetical protein